MTQEEIRNMAPLDAMARWPLLTAHLIAQSLGAVTPGAAAIIVLDAANGAMNHSEWMTHTFQGNAEKAVETTFKNRATHKGFMADFSTALSIVKVDLDSGERTRFCSWF